ncbi:MAG: heavy metal-responsive transcriptional regulator [Deltaproteobacteria bacterium]|nr:heavy metal-responsive transcriptional regulator [Deltaproteobacteria bacterium]RLB48361.1 MAG: heavy metal-responsive transcriptional regulator [Deltaproteobacteria bacterium]
MSKPAPESLKIGEVATRAGVRVDTVRYYERAGLIAEPPRRQSGFRQYSPDVVRRIRFIRRAKDLGFSLKEIQELLSLRADPRSTCKQVRAQAEAKIADIDSRISTLRKMKRALSEVTAPCSGGDAPAAECPILASLDTDPD